MSGRFPPFEALEWNGPKVTCYYGRPLTGRETAIAREAYIVGCRDPIREVARRKAEEIFPWPTIMQPRVVRYTDLNARESMIFRVVDGQLQAQVNGFGETWLDDAWTRFQFVAAKHPELLRLWADLFARPNEEVEAPE